jgi:hypothetical protein
VKITPLVSGPGILVISVFLAGCISSMGWETNLGVGTCVQRAKLALRDSDFNQGLEIVGDRGNRTVIADHGSYQARLNCMLHDVDFIVIGPDYNQALWYRDTIIRKF